MNLLQTIECLSELYGLRNAMFFRGDARAMLLHRGVRSLNYAIRKERPVEEVTVMLASAFARSVAFADSFVDLPIVFSLCKKYPETGCAYCENIPCECELNRGKHIKISSVSEGQMSWTISEWIDHMDRVYGEVNKKRGISTALLRLIEEMHEVESAHLFDDMSDSSIGLSVRRENVALELADLFAWIFSIAAMLKLPLQKTIYERYCGFCKRCTKRPCDCGSPMYYSKRANPKNTSNTSYI